MITEGLIITAVGMTGAFLFLLLLVAAMNAQAAAFRYLGIEDAPAAKDPENGSDDEALVAAIAAVKLKNG